MFLPTIYKFHTKDQLPKYKDSQYSENRLKHLYTWAHNLLSLQYNPTLHFPPYSANTTNHSQLCSLFCIVRVDKAQWNLAVVMIRNNPTFFNLASQLFTQIFLTVGAWTVTFDIYILKRLIIFVIGYMIQLLIPFSLFLTRLCFLQDLFAILCKKVLQKTDHSPLPSDIIFVNTHTNSPLSYTSL